MHDERRSGSEHEPTPELVWDDDPPPPGRPAPRTLPPDHAERVAGVILDRVAGGTRLRRRTVRHRWRRLAVGSLLLAAGGVLYWQQVDAGLLFIGSITLAVVGGVVILNGLLRP